MLDGAVCALHTCAYCVLRKNLYRIEFSFVSKVLTHKEEMASSDSEGLVIKCHTVKEWDEQIQKGNDNKKLIVVDFTASWCGPCQLISPFFTQLAKKLPSVTFLKVDVDQLMSVATDWAVEAMPTFIILKEGKILDKVVGANKEELQQTISKHLV